MAAPYASARWPAALATTGVWALAAASIVFWGLRLAAPTDTAAPPAVARTPAAPDPAAVARMLGAVSGQAAAEVAAPEAANRFALLGVVADTDQQGAALIAVDGKPARPFRVGAQVADGFVLQSVTRRSAALGAGLEGEAALTLQLPTQPLAVPSPPLSASVSMPAPASPAPPPSPASGIAPRLRRP